MKKIYEDYDPNKDTEHITIWDGRKPATRDELIQWAGELANLSGKRVRINAMNIVPSEHKSTDWLAVAGWAIGALFVLTLLLGIGVAAIAALTGNIP